MSNLINVSTGRWPGFGAGGVLIGTRHSWRDYGLARTPDEGPVTVVPSAPKLNYVTVPMMDGDLDNTTALTGEVAFEPREGTWRFCALPDSSPWSVRQSVLASRLGAYKTTIVLDIDQAHSYTGRVWLSGFTAHRGYADVEIGYHLSARKTTRSILNEDWMWDRWLDEDLSIYFGSFAIPAEGVWRALYNPYPYTTDIQGGYYLDSPMIEITVSATCYADIDGKTYELSPEGIVQTAGTTELLLLRPGYNIARFYGPAGTTVRIAYTMEESL